MTSNASKYSATLTTRGFPSLTIRSVDKSDAANYDCQLANELGFSERLPVGESCKLSVKYTPLVELHVLQSSVGSLIGQSSARLHALESSGELIRVDLESKLVRANDAFVLACELLDAMPRELLKVQWLRRRQASDDWQLLATSNAKFLALPALEANATGALFACVGLNELGAGRQSNEALLALSKAPGKFPSLRRSPASSVSQIELFWRVTSAAFARSKRRRSSQC